MGLGDFSDHFEDRGVVGVSESPGHRAHEVRLGTPSGHELTAFFEVESGRLSGMVVPG